MSRSTAHTLRRPVRIAPAFEAAAPEVGLPREVLGSGYRGVCHEYAEARNQ